MEPITITIILAALSLITVAVVYITYLTMKQMEKWFQKVKNRNAIPEGDKANLGFTIIENMKNNNFNLIRGVFNTDTQKVVEAERVKAKENEELELDEELEEAHSDNELVLYN